MLSISPLVGKRSGIVSENKPVPGIKSSDSLAVPTPTIGIAKDASGLTATDKFNVTFVKAAAAVDLVGAHDVHGLNLMT